MRRIASRGMVQVQGATYRIERLEPHCYAVVRLLDDVAMGSFRTLPALRLHPLGCEVDLFTEIVRTALRFARTSGMMRAMPSRQPEEQPAVQRSSSSLPPRPAMA